MKSPQTGVTLIELLTVVVVLGILASIAVPSYRSYLIRTNRTDAKSALMQIQAAEEKYFLQYNKYTFDLTSKAPDGLGMSNVTANGYYALSVEERDEDTGGFIATATPTSAGGQNDDKTCGYFTLNDRGARGVEVTANKSTCWK